MEPQLLRFTTAGSVDDGKSTLIGRLLHDSHAVYEDQLEAVRKASRGAPDLAFLTDGLRAEREQGITIDVAYRYFSTPRRRFIIADTPGHEQYTRNMATGASTAQVAVILLDARRGVLPQTRRHAYIAWLLGIRHIAAAVNKMDLVGWRQDVFERFRRDFECFAAKLPGCRAHFIPVSALDGDNIVRASARMPGFAGGSLLEYLETVPVTEFARDAPFRLPVQYVIRAQDFRGYAGQIASGSVHAGDEVLVLPSRRVARVESLRSFNGSLERAFAPMSATVSLADHVDAGRGDMLADPERPPLATQRFRASLVWMDETPLALNRPYLVKHTTQQVCAEVVRLVSTVDLETLEDRPAGDLHMNDIGTVEIETHRPLFCDPYDENRQTGGFVLIDPTGNQTLAAGMIRSAVEAGQQATPRALGRRGLVVWFTGLSASGKTTLSRTVYERLWAMGLPVHLLDGDEVRRNLSRDLGFSKHDRDENIRRIGFVAGLLSGNGVIVLVSAVSPYRAARDEVRARADEFVEIYVNAPLEICERRDSKGLYQRARAGELHDFTGIDDPYEPPLNPEVECRTDRETVAESVDKILHYLESRLS